MPRGGTCAVHPAEHRPRYAGTEVHHIQPLGMGGADVAVNRVEVCPTGHTNIHTYMSWLIFGSFPEPRVHPQERRLALAGVASWEAAGKPGNPHAAYGLHAGADTH